MTNEKHLYVIHILYYQQCRNIHFTINSEANASELLENLEEIIIKSFLLKQILLLSPQGAQQNGFRTIYIYMGFL